MKKGTKNTQKPSTKTAKGSDPNLAKDEELSAKDLAKATGGAMPSTREEVKK